MGKWDKESNSTVHKTINKKEGVRFYLIRLQQEETLTVVSVAVCFMHQECLQCASTTHTHTYMYLPVNADWA